MLKLAVSGALGRMGQTIIDLASKDKYFELTTLLEHKNHAQKDSQIKNIKISTDNQTIKNSDVLIEFTLPEGTIENLRAAVEYQVKLVIGTTGFSSEQIEEIKKASEHIPIVFASNMSIGVNTLFKLIQIAGEKLTSINDISIGETHHIHKKDKPSGTAKTMQELASKASNLSARFDESKVKREGEVIGYHEITFETDFDTLTITHNAKDRSMFANGALTAAKFLADKKSGLFNMQDVLALK